ncbi:MAG: thioredoxin domain-containing protein [Saprospiraceae bacterium]|nr:thioredoxin domain-containing protein [Saprospiraceae bacterium]
MNRLQFETSPYLRQHMHNPVDWFAWKPEAFEKAKKDNKPILVSIGYSTCHWCHVMERESFEDREVAEFMNDHFINIKVDREERPDVDQIYMEACQILSGGGGWPLNCFLTPDGRPFYAGTYFPPKPAFNRPSWLQVLGNISRNFQQRREVVEDQADKLTEMIARTDRTFLPNQLPDMADSALFTPALMDDIFANLAKSFDKLDGGFGSAPKFPGVMSLQWLLHYYYFTGTQAAVDHVFFSLDKMSGGGIYDHLGGGFARYATDRAWRIPHFEKMLYDNALLVSLLSEAYSLSQSAYYKKTITDTLDFIEREMTSPEGAFYSALDADSEGVEGKFYVWDYSDITAALGKNAAEFCDFFGVTPEGNWEHTNILWQPQKLEVFAAERGVSPSELSDRLDAGRRILMALRDQRIRPGLDDKILLSWNALQCTAYAQAYQALGVDAYREAALRNLRFLQQKMTQPGKLDLLHTYKDGVAQYDAFLEDYAFYIEALLEAYHITFDTAWLDAADNYADFVIRHFLDEEARLFYFTAESQQDILMRKKELYDSATPSGNSTMVTNLLKLGILLDKPAYREQAAAMCRQLADSVTKYPSSFSRWAIGMSTLAYGMREIAITGAHAHTEARALLAAYLPQKVLMATSETNDNYPLLSGKIVGADTNIFICKDYACRLPVSTLAQALQLLKPERL